MSRRDTIILAVLINAGLLAILFVTAVHVDEQQVMPRLEEKPASQEVFLQDKMPAVQLAQVAVQHDAPVSFQANVKAPADMKSSAMQPLALSNQKPVPIVVEPVKTPPPIVDSAVKFTFPASTEPFVEVTVKKGDFLEKIAKSNSTTVKAIMDANELKSTHLRVGQVLKIPVSSSVSSSQNNQISQNNFASNSSANGDYYTVQPGDNPWMISKKVGVSLEKLLEINGLNEERARKLKPGDQIKIR